MIYDRRKSGLWTPRHGAPAILPSWRREAWAFRARQSAGAGAASPSDPYWANVVSLVTGYGTNNTQPATDSKGNTLTWTGGGDQFIKTAVYYWAAYGSSYHGDGGGYLRIGAAPSISGDFTYDGFFYISSFAPSNNAGLFVTNNDQTTGMSCKVRLSDSKISLQIAGTPYNGSTALSTGAWHYLWVGRSGSAVKVYVDTVLEVSVTDASSITSNSGIYGVSGTYDNGGANNPLVGYLTDMRFTNGVYRPSPGVLPTYPAPTH